jgi:hypothetical protein
MSFPPPSVSPQEPLTSKQANAQAKAANAQSEALRPWYKKKRTWLLGLIVLIVIIVIANRGGDPGATTAVPAGSAESSAPAEAKETKAAEPAAAKIGDSVTAGDLEFKVTKVKCGVSKVGSEYADEKAQGQFCLSNVSATNNGSDSEVMLGSNQKVD